MGRNRHESTKVLLTIDLANAFNSVDRCAVRQAIRRVLPEAAPWVDCCYGSPSVVLLGTHDLPSQRGVQQGDPLGPALFPIAMHEHILQAIQESQSKFPNELDMAAFYLDDGVRAGSARAVAQVAETLFVSFASIGLEVDTSKCEIIPPVGSSFLSGGR